MAGKNNRQHLRTGVVVEIELTFPDNEVMLLKTRDISNGGLYLAMDKNITPAIGTEVQLRINNQFDDGEEPPINRAVVVRHDAEGIGLKFLDV